MSLSTLSISMPTEMKEQLNAELLAAGFASASDWARTQARQFLREREIEKLRAMVVEGLQGPVVATWGPEYVASLKERIMAKAKTGGAA